MANKIGGGGGDVTANEREFTLMGGSVSRKDAKTQRAEGRGGGKTEIRIILQKVAKLTKGGGLGL